MADNFIQYHLVTGYEAEMGSAGLAPSGRSLETIQEYVWQIQAGGHGNWQVSGGMGSFHNGLRVAGHDLARSPKVREHPFTMAFPVIKGDVVRMVPRLFLLIPDCPGRVGGS